MIHINIATSPAKGTHDPWDVASTTIDGIAYSERSRSSAIAKLARSIVAAGIPDQPWKAITTHGTVSLRGRSIHAIAKTTITESDREGLRQRIWQPHPAGLCKEGAEATSRVNGTNQDLEAAQRQTQPDTNGCMKSGHFVAGSLP